MLMRNFIKKLKENRFIKSVCSLSAGAIMAQLIGLVTTPIVSRLYSPSAYGDYAIIVSVSSIISSLASLGLNSAIMAGETEEECKSIFTVTFWISVFFVFCACTILMVISPLVKLFDAGINYITACILVGCLTVFNLLSALLAIYMNRKGLNKALMINSIIGALATLCITVPLGFCKIGMYGMYLAAVISAMLCSFLMIRKANPFKKITISDMKNVFRTQKKYVIYQYPANIIDTITYQAPTQVYSNVFGNDALGGYNMSEKILGLPSRLIATPINTVYFRTATEYTRENKDLSKFTFRLLMYILLIAFIPMVITILFAEPIFTFILGADWGEAGQYASIMILYYVFRFCTTSVSYCRVVIGKQTTNFLMSFLNLAVVAGSLAFGILVFQDILYAILCFVISYSFLILIDLTITLKCLGKYWVKFLFFSLIYWIISVALILIVVFLI